MNTRRRAARSPLRRFLFWAGLAAALSAAAVIAPHFLPHDPYLVDLGQVNRPPDGEYLMGTDYIGRCVACRIAEGAARSVFSALAVAAISFAAGTAVGVVCGCLGGVTDTVLMRIVDGVQSFPSLIFTVAAAGMLGPGMKSCIIAMSAVGWTGYARLARSQVMAVRTRPFVDAARLSGQSGAAVLLRTILPNCLRPLVVSASMHVGSAILGFAGLSYLGLGSAPPYPEWGTMLSDAQDRLQTAPWAVFFPGLAILGVVMIAGMLGDSINELLDPQNKRAARRRENDKEGLRP